MSVINEPKYKHGLLQAIREQLERLDAAYRAEVTNMKEIVAEIVPTYHPAQKV